MAGRKNTIADFWAHVKIAGPDECWEWTGAKMHKGYGVIRFQGKGWRAHRLAWMLTYGAIPDEMLACHTCDRVSCVNPAHLFLGTITDNNRDCIAKGRTNPQRGEEIAWSKLTEDEVREIRRLHALGGISYVALGKRFDVSETLIRHIVARKQWRHI